MTVTKVLKKSDLRVCDPNKLLKDRELADNFISGGYLYDLQKKLRDVCANCDSFDSSANEYVRRHIFGKGFRNYPKELQLLLRNVSKKWTVLPRGIVIKEYSNTADNQKYIECISEDAKDTRMGGRMLPLVVINHTLKIKIRKHEIPVKLLVVLMYGKYFDLDYEFSETAYSELDIYIHHKDNNFMNCHFNNLYLSPHRRRDAARKTYLSKLNINTEGL